MYILIQQGSLRILSLRLLTDERNMNLMNRMCMCLRWKVEYGHSGHEWGCGGEEAKSPETCFYDADNCFVIITNLLKLHKRVSSRVLVRESDG